MSSDLNREFHQVMQDSKQQKIMSTRTRLIYSKRGGACFVPHIALAQMFSRSATRAGLTLTMTQGFTPRAKISFGPELPAGVVALNEPVDIFIEDSPHDIAARMNDSLPEGFAISRAIFTPEDSPSLGKLCKAAEYLIHNTNGINLTPHAEEFYAESVILSGNVDGWTRIIISDPAQNPIGGFIRRMKEEGVIAGWHEVNAVRVAVGIYDGAKKTVKL